jgi:hypothetical protein
MKVCDGIPASESLFLWRKRSHSTLYSLLLVHYFLTSLALVSCNMQYSFISHGILGPQRYIHVTYHIGSSAGHGQRKCAPRSQDASFRSLRPSPRHVFRTTHHSAHYPRSLALGWHMIRKLAGISACADLVAFDPGTRLAGLVRPVDMAAPGLPTAQVPSGSRHHCPRGTVKDFRGDHQMYMV